MEYDFWRLWDTCKGDPMCNVCSHRKQVNSPNDVLILDGRFIVGHCTSCGGKGTVSIMHPTTSEFRRFMQDLKKHGAKSHYHAGHYMVAAGTILFILLIAWGILGEIV